MLKEIIKLAKEKDFTDFEVAKSSNTSLSISLEKSSLSQNQLSKDQTLSFKGIYNGKAVYASCENQSLEVINEVLDIMISNAKTITINEPEIIYEGSKKYPKIPKHDFDYTTIPFAKKLKLVEDLEKECLKIDNLKILESCNYAEAKTYNEIINTKGLNLQSSSSYANLYPFAVIEKDGDIVDDYEVELKYDFGFNPIKLAQTFGTNINKQLGANEKINNETRSVIFSPNAMSTLLHAFISNFTANSRFFKRTKLLDKLNTLIASPKITLVDDATYDKALLQSQFDAEGVAHQKNVIIDRGVFKLFLNNLKMASIFKEEPTGNASSGNGIDVTNLYIENGTTPLKELFKTAGDGTLYVDSLMGVHAGVNPVSGDFSLQSKGFIVQDGELKKPYRMVIISGNFYDLLKNVIDVADDMCFTPRHATTGSPSILVDKITIVAEQKK